MAMTDARLTAAEYFDAVARIREPAQLIDGVIVVDQPKYRHQRAVGLFHARLLSWAESPVGHGVVSLPLDITVDDHNVYAPDVLWVADEARVTPDDLFEGVPDLAIEVRSPSTWRYDIGVKKRRYEQHGLPELWLVDTDAAEVLVFRRSSPHAAEFDVALELASGDAVTSSLLPGFAVQVDDVLRDR